MPTNIGGQDFEAIPEITLPPEPEKYSLSGVVSGPVVDGITISLQGTGTGTTTTSGGGNYSFADLPAGVYVVTPTLAGHTFTPPQLIVNLTSNTSAQNFTTIPPVVPDTYTVSGTVTGAVVAGVTMNLSGAATASTTTDASGNYSFTNLEAGTYVIVPSKAEFIFDPPFRIVAL